MNRIKKFLCNIFSLPKPFGVKKPSPNGALWDKMASRFNIKEKDQVMTVHQEYDHSTEEKITVNDLGQ